MTKRERQRQRRLEMEKAAQLSTSAAAAPMPAAAGINGSGGPVARPIKVAAPLSSSAKTPNRIHVAKLASMSPLDINRSVDANELFQPGGEDVLSFLMKSPQRPAAVTAPALSAP